MNELNLHGRHPKELPDKETIDDILLELEDTNKFDITWIDLKSFDSYMNWKANGKVFNEWKEKGEVRKQTLRKHGDELMVKLKKAISDLEQQIDCEIATAVQKHESIEDNVKSIMRQCTEAILEMETAQNNEIIDLTPYKKLLKDVDIYQPIPEVNLTLDLSDLTDLTEELLLGKVQCSEVNKIYS